jgi:CheY-like chemotaxis protein
MKHILIVDDEKPFLLSVRDGLAFAGQFKIHLAINGQDAVRILAQESIDLVVTDLKMPVMDGFQLLAYMSTRFPGIPVVVMTAFGTPEIEERLKNVDTFRFLEKPLDLDALANAIEAGLARGARSFIRGITLAAFLQLVKMEGKTCTLRIKSESGRGKLFINRGELFDAETDNKTGEAAAYQIVCWPNSEIEMEGTCSRTERVIQESIEHLLLEAFRLEDERRNTEQENQFPAASPGESGLFDLQSLMDEFSDPSEGRHIPAGSDSPNFAPAAAIPEQPETSIVQFMQQAPGILEFALFDARDLLRLQYPESTGLGKWHPSLYFPPAEIIGAKLEHGLDFIEMRDPEGRCFLLFRAGENQVVAEIKKGGRGAETIHQLRRVCRLS